MDLSNETTQLVVDEVRQDDDEKASDTDSDDDLPPLFTPTKANAKFQRGDLLFAKFRTCVYWPGVFYRYMGKKKTKKCKPKAYVYFFDDTSDLSLNPNTYKRILPVCIDRIKRFTCPEKDGIVEAGSKQKGFAHGISQAEDYMRKHALGKIPSFFEYTNVEENNINDKDNDEDNDDEDDVDQDQTTGSQKENLSDNVLLSSDDEGTDNEKDGKAKLTPKKLFTGVQEKPKYESDVLKTWIKNHSRPILAMITRGEKESRRHQTFCNGTQKQKDKLRWDSGFGDLDERSGEEIFDRLLEWFRDTFNSSEYNAIQYVSDVWLPEACIHALSSVKSISYADAEKEYLR